MAIGTLKQHSLTCQPIDIRCLSDWISIASQLHSQIIHGEEQDIWLLARLITRFGLSRSCFFCWGEQQNPTGPRGLWDGDSISFRDVSLIDLHRRSASVTVLETPVLDRLPASEFRPFHRGRSRHKQNCWLVGGDEDMFEFSPVALKELPAVESLWHREPDVGAIAVRLLVVGQSSQFDRASFDSERAELFRCEWFPLVLEVIEVTIFRTD